MELIYGRKFGVAVGLVDAFKFEAMHKGKYGIQKLHTHIIDGL